MTRSSTGSSAGFRLNDDDASAAGESSRPRDVSTRAAPPRDYGFAAWDDDTKRGDELVAGAARRGSKKAGKGAGAGAGGGKKSKDGGKKSKAGGAIGSGGAADAQRWIDSWRAQAAAAVVALKGGNPMSLAAPDDDDDADDDAPGSEEARSRSKSKSSDVGTRRPSILPHGGSIPSIAFAQSKLTMASSTSSSSSSGAPGAEKKLIDALDTDRELELVKMTHADGRDSKLKDPTAPPTKGTDLLNSGETLSPELALKMARNGHLAAFSGGASLSTTTATATQKTSILRPKDVCLRAALTHSAVLCWSHPHVAHERHHGQAWQRSGRTLLRLARPLGLHEPNAVGGH